MDTWDEIKKIWEEYEKWNAEYEKKFGYKLGFRWGIGLDAMKIAIECMKRAIERGTEITLEEYYGEIIGFSPEEVEKIKKGEILI